MNKKVSYAIIGAILGIPLSYYFQLEVVKYEMGGISGYIQHLDQITKYSSLLENVVLSVVIFAILGGVIGYFIDENEAKNDKIIGTGTGIEIVTGFFPLAWVLYFVTPIIEINGDKHKERWGTKFYPLSPGEYIIKISFPYMGKSECGANEIKVSLTENQQRKIVYNMPPWMFAKGSLKII